jgi:hypothetical protein
VIPQNTYIVLDIPSPVAERVIAQRRHQRDPFRYSLPAETTVSGSSGTGPLAPDQAIEDIVAVLERVAADTPPIRTQFGPVRRFGGSDVFYLSFADETPLRALHDRIARSGLRFQPTSFAFTPHCTLRTRAPIAAHEVRELESIRVEGEFLLDTMSLYDLPVERQGARTAPDTGFTTLLCLLHRTTLRGV